MFVLDDRYVSLVSFIDGVALAEGLEMQKFQRWMLERLRREPSSLHWGLSLIHI